MSTAEWATAVALVAITFNRDPAYARIVALAGILVIGVISYHR